MFSVLAPFSMAVWIGILFSYILVTIILFIIDRFSSYERYSLKSSGVATRQKCSVYNALFCCCDFFNDQGIPYSIASKTKLLVKPISIMFLMKNLVFLRSCCNQFLVVLQFYNFFLVHCQLARLYFCRKVSSTH